MGYGKVPTKPKPKPKAKPRPKPPAGQMAPGGGKKKQKRGYA